MSEILTAYYHSSSDIRFYCSIMQRLDHLAGNGIAITDDKRSLIRTAFKAPAVYADNPNVTSAEVDKTMRLLVERVKQYKDTLIEKENSASSLDIFWNYFRWGSSSSSKNAKKQSETSSEADDKSMDAILFYQFKAALDDLFIANNVDGLYYKDNLFICYGAYNFTYEGYEQRVRKDFCDWYLAQIQPEFTLTTLHRRLKELLNDEDLFYLPAYALTLKGCGNYFIENSNNSNSAFGSVANQLKSFAHTSRNVFTPTEYRNLSILTNFFGIFQFCALMTSISLAVLGFETLAAVTLVTAFVGALCCIATALCVQSPQVLAFVSDVSAYMIESTSKALGHILLTVGEYIEDPNYTAMNLIKFEEAQNELSSLVRVV